MDEAVQEAKLLRQVNALIVAHLRGQNLGQAASAVAADTMTPLSAADSVPGDQLLRLVAKVPSTLPRSLPQICLARSKPLLLATWFNPHQGLAAERGGAAASLFDSAAGYGGVVPPLRSSAVDFRYDPQLYVPAARTCVALVVSEVVTQDHVVCRM